MRPDRSLSSDPGAAPQGEGQGSTPDLAACAAMGGLFVAKEPEGLDSFVETLLPPGTPIQTLWGPGKVVVSDEQGVITANLRDGGQVVTTLDDILVLAPARTGFQMVSTESLAFRNWFQGSQIVDAEGAPLKLLHGTTSGPGEAGVFIRGQGFYIYTTPDPVYAGQFAEGIDAQILPLYVRAENPLDLRGLGPGLISGHELHRTLRSLGVTEETAGRMGAHRTGTEMPAFAWAKHLDSFKWGLVDSGFDAIWLQETTGGIVGDSLLVFRPDQLKSAVSNTGQFCRTEADIRA